MKKLILSVAFMLAVYGWAEAQNTPPVSSKESALKTEEKSKKKDLKNGPGKKDKKASATIQTEDIKLPIPDHTTYAADTTSLAPKPKNEK